MIHPVFGRVDPTTNNYWQAETQFLGRTVHLDLSIDGGAIEAEAFDRVARLASDLSALDRIARAALREDCNQDEAVALYRTHHLAELDEETRVQCFGTGNVQAVGVDLFLSRTHLFRVGLYPETAVACVVLDYSLGPNVTDYVLAISVDVLGQVTSVDMES